MLLAPVKEAPVSKSVSASAAKKHCCEAMRYWAGYRCEEHADPAACPDNIIFFSKTEGSYGIRIHDGGSSYIEIKYCPWCGAHLTPNPAVNRTCAKSRAGRLP